ncbi:MAG: hypothetical protein V7647_231 [Acidobacteriota bacterium]|jgi:hypothetical protein
MRVLILLSSLALALGAGADAAPSRGTLRGVVMRGPVAPVCVAEQPCDEPAAHVELLFLRNNNSVAGHAVTDLAGRYAVRLPGGLYTVRRSAVAGPLDRKLEPNRARVYAGRTNRVDFSIDTGIR